MQPSPVSRIPLSRTLLSGTQSVRAPGTVALVVGPALLLGGVLLMMTPGAWTASHLVFLAGTLAMLPTGLVLHDLLVGTGQAWVRRTGLALTLVGALTLAGQFVIDFVVMRLAGGDGATAATMFDHIQGEAALALIFYSVGPALLFTGLAWCGVALVVRSGLRFGPGWMLVAGSLLMGAARIIGSRPTEVAALALILGALALIARSGAGGPIRPRAIQG